MKAIKNPAMHMMISTPFRKWVADRFETMSDDMYWRRDNAALVPQAQRIAYAAAHNEPVCLEDAKCIQEEVVSFEDVIREYASLGDAGIWNGAKRFMVEAGLVTELTKERAEKIYVSRGRPEWFRYGGKMYE